VFLINLFFAFFAQTVSLLASFLMQIIVPKMLGITEFGYWQLFIFYSGYVGLFHFGLNDGVYLKYGGTPYNKLNKKLLGSQFWIAMIVQIFIATLIVFGGYLRIENQSRFFVIIAAAICLVLVNSSLYIGYVFQSSNLTKLFSMSVMVDRLSFIAFILIILLFRGTHFEIFVFAFLLSKFISLLYCCMKGKDIVFIRFCKLNNVLYEIIDNIKIGIKLLIANIASTLIIGYGQFITDHRWGIDTFGKLSFSLALTNFFIVFMSQFSMVLFPALRQNDDKLNQYFKKIRSYFSIIFLAVPLLYFPTVYILKLWLPQYYLSFQFMILLLPLCIFEGKMQILCNTYLKVLRKERQLLIINIMTLTLSIILVTISAYCINHLTIVVLSMAISVIFRSVIAELYLSKIMQIKSLKYLIMDLTMVIIFSSTTWIFKNMIAFVLYLLVYLIYIIHNKKIFISLLRNIKNTQLWRKRS
jgi:O-antigen/teichoic acid export membrane protein